MSKRRNARWVTILGVVGLGIASLNSSAVTNMAWLLVYALFVALVAQSWWWTNWTWIKLALHQFLVLGIIQSIGIVTLQDGGVTSPNTLFAGIFLGFAVSGLVTLTWIAVARAASWLEERFLSLRP